MIESIMLMAPPASFDMSGFWHKQKHEAACTVPGASTFTKWPKDYPDDVFPVFFYSVISIFVPGPGPKRLAVRSKQSWRIEMGKRELKSDMPCVRVTHRAALLEEQLICSQNMSIEFFFTITLLNR